MAIRTKLWDPATADTIPFNFGWIYGNNRQSTGFACTRRVWRVFTLAAPSLLAEFSPYTDGLGTFGFGPDGSLPYPFSVKPDTPLTVQDIMNMNRDQYEGTPFDLTKGADGGTYASTISITPYFTSCYPHPPFPSSHLLTLLSLPILVSTPHPCVSLITHPCFHFHPSSHHPTL